MCRFHNLTARPKIPGSYVPKYLEFKPSVLKSGLKSLILGSNLSSDTNCNTPDFQDI
jgi:hypothetical protein